MQNFDDDLTRLQAFGHLGPLRPFAQLVHQVTRHRQCDIGFKQADP